MLFRYELKRILVDGGYIDMDTGEYHFYVSDHLGNNRAVVREDGEVIQQTHYYPFGMAFADSKGREEQAYKYNGKELDTKFQLNTYDYAARYMDPSIGRFTSIDPHAENYFSWSPYAYVGNNPMRLTDPTGMDWFVDGSNGNVYFFNGVDRLTQDMADKYGLGDLKNYERLGADNMFGDKVLVDGYGDILKYDVAIFGESSSTFMESQGYDKVDRLEVTREEKMMQYMETEGSLFHSEPITKTSEEGRFQSYAKPDGLYNPTVTSDLKFGPLSKTEITNYSYKVPTGTPWTYSDLKTPPPNRALKDIKIAGKTLEFNMKLFEFVYETWRKSQK